MFQDCGGVGEAAQRFMADIRAGGSNHGPCVHGTVTSSQLCSATVPPLVLRVHRYGAWRSPASTNPDAGSVKLASLSPQNSSMSALYIRV